MFKTLPKNNELRYAVSLQLLIQPLILLSAFMVTIQAQRPGVSQPARDMVRAIGMKEMDRLLLSNLSSRRTTIRQGNFQLKQISEDFRGVQEFE